MKVIKPRHFIFGYGSLICPMSREITCPSLGTQVAAPVTLNNVERTWSARTKSGYTAMGVRFRKRAKCTGVLLEVNSRELAQMDIREKAYDRRPIDLRFVEKVPYLGESTDSEDDGDHVVFQEKHHTKLNVWIYVQKEASPPAVSHPIPQSYVDIIMRGCLSISPDFARSFIETTSGWHASHANVAHWIDDRANPIYIRADPEYSSMEGSYIDELLEECIPDAFEQRVEYDAFTHKSTLEQFRQSQLSTLLRD